MRRVWVGVAALVVMATLVGVAALILTVRQQEEGSRVNMRDSLTLSAARLQAQTNEREQIQVAAGLQTESITLVPTTAPTATMGSDAPVGFSMMPLAGRSITADGVSRLPLQLTTIDPASAGKTVIFLVYGSGSVDPSEVTLPLVGGEPLEVHYVAGRAATTVRVEAVLNETGQRESVSLETTAEQFQIFGYPDGPPELLQDNQTLVIPITLRIESSTDDPLVGTYIVNLQAFQGTVALTRTDMPRSTADITFDRRNNTATVYFVRSFNVPTGRLLAEASARDDVTPLDIPVFWRNTAYGLNFVDFGNMGWIRRSVGENICVRVWNESFSSIQPNTLRLRYTTLLTSDAAGAVNLVLNSLFVADAGWTSTEGGLQPVLTQNLENCFPLQLPQSEGGLVQLEVQADNRQAQDSEAFLIYHRRVRFSSPSDLQISAPSLTRSPAQLLLPARSILVGYLLSSGLYPNAPVMLSLLVAPEAVDADNRLRLPPGQSLLTFYTDQQNALIVANGEIPERYAVLPIPVNGGRRRVFVLVSAGASGVQSIVEALPPTQVPNFPPTFIPAATVTPIVIDGRLTPYTTIPLPTAIVPTVTLLPPVVLPTATLVPTAILEPPTAEPPTAEPPTAEPPTAEPPTATG